jgi:hypothetical protein
LSDGNYVTHVGFGDESHWNVGRFRSLGLATTMVASLDTLNAELWRLLGESGVREFRWKKLGGAKKRFAAEKLCRCAVDKACSAHLRVDVLVWDIEDSRHRVARRDEIANLERMYYHLFRNVLRTRWPYDAVWRLHPDEHTSIDWETVQNCLENVGTRVEIENSLFSGGEFRLKLRREFGVEEICPVSSGEHPLLQVADLFAGMAIFSREKYAEYEQWCTSISPQLNLPYEANTTSTASGCSRERFKILIDFDRLCKQRRLGVSLNTSRGLRTHKPENPINFWWYEPQHPLDKAPQRSL